MGRPSKLKTLSLEVQQKVINWHNRGFSDIYIANQLKESGFDLDQRSVGRFIEAYKKDLEGNRKPLQQTPLKCPEPANNIDVLVVDISALKLEYGLYDDLSKPENVIGNAQILAAEILLLEQLITIQKLKGYAKGLTKHPSEAIKGYKIAYEVFSSVWGIEQSINVNAAMKTVENYYGNLESIKHIEKIEETQNG